MASLPRLGLTCTEARLEANPWASVLSKTRELLDYLLHTCTLAPTLTLTSCSDAGRPWDGRAGWERHAEGDRVHA